MHESQVQYSTVCICTILHLVMQFVKCLKVLCGKKLVVLQYTAKHSSTSYIIVHLCSLHNYIFITCIASQSTQFRQESQSAAYMTNMHSSWFACMMPFKGTTDANDSHASVSLSLLLEIRTYIHSCYFKKGYL